MQNSTYERADARTITASQINILVACEESQRECVAFRRLGFNAFSCDIQKCSGHHPEWHIHDDVSPLLHGKVVFETQNGQQHFVSRWHLILSHPPCIYLCKVGSPWMIHNGIINEDRYEKMLNARAFFFECLNAQADYVAVENPLPMARAQLPRPSCYACPSWFGVKYTKKTLYWTKNLPPIMAGMQFPNAKCFVRSSRGKYRSRTFTQLANAIAEQWGNFILDDLNLRALQTPPRPIGHGVER